MSVFGGLEDNAPDGSLYVSPDTVPDDDTAVAWGGAPGAVPGEVPGEGSGDSDLLERAAAQGRFDSLAGGARGGARGGAASDLAGDATSSGAGRATAHAALARKRKKRLSITVTGMEHTKNELIVWFDVQTSLPRFRNSSSRGVRRTHTELRRFADHLIVANPECFVPALPAATNSYPVTSPEHDERLLQSFQRWFDRVCASPLLARDEEFLYLVEASFGYAPMTKIKAAPAGLARKVLKQFAPPPDDVDELRNLRPMAKLLYKFSDESHKQLARVTKSRKELAVDLHEFGTAVQRFASGDDAMSQMWNRFGKAVLVTGEAENTKAVLEEATYGDCISTVARDAYIIKETLTNRHIMMKDLIKAQAATSEKHQRATRIKGTASISPRKVDDAIAQLEDAASLERHITSGVRRVSDNLVAEKQLALGRIEADVLEAISSCALRFIEQERRTLAAWESARPGVRAADKNGGLSHLGRDLVASPRRHRHSQGFTGDEWSDRAARAKDIAPIVPDAGAEPEVLDKKNAASILAESIF